MAGERRSKQGKDAGGAAWQSHAADEDAALRGSDAARRVPEPPKSRHKKCDWRRRSVACRARSLRALKLVAPPSKRCPVGFRGPVSPSRNLNLARTLAGRQVSNAYVSANSAI